MKNKRRLLLVPLLMLGTIQMESCTKHYNDHQTVSVTSVTLDKTCADLFIGDTLSLVATVLPENAANKNITWTSSNNEVVTVDNGLVTAVGAGNATITVTTADGNLTATCSINVSAVNVNSVTLDKTEANLYIGENLTLVQTVLPSNATNKNVTWLTNNSDVADVNDGVVTAKSVGDAVITVKTIDSEFTASCAVSVSAVSVTSVTLDKTEAEVYLGENLTLVETVLPENATNKNVTWSSSNTEVATVDGGLVTTNSLGSTIITVTTEDGSFFDSCTVNVVEDTRPVYEIPEAYGDYYDGLVSWTNGEDLRAQLKAIMTDGYVMNHYANPTNWTTNTNADKALDNHSKVDVVYNANDEWAADNGSKTGGWQREHAFCASLMTGVMTGSAVQFIGRATDFHNLWASNQSGNGSRGNRNLGYVEDSELSTDNPTIGDCRRSTDEINTFEPANKDKGRLARSIFYIATMYDDNVLEANNSETKNKTYSTGSGDSKKTYTFDDVYGQGVKLQEENAAAYTYAHGNLSDLLSFNTTAVDRLEYQHMNYVYGEQKNRNVYVDYPELVDYAFGDKQNEAGQLKYLKPSAIDLKLDEEGVANYAIDNVKHSYKSGDTFSSSDFKVVAVNNDYSETTVDVENYTCSLDYNYTFTDDDIGTKEICVNVGDQVIKYSITIEQSDSLASCSWKHYFTKADLNKTVDAVNEITVDGLGFNFSFTSKDTSSAPTVGSLSAGKGVQLGTGTKMCQTVYFETTNSLADITKAYIALDTASGCTATLNIYLDGEVVDTKTVTYNATAAQNYGLDFAEAKTGKIKFEITNINKAIYVYALGISYSSIVTE